MSNFDFVEKCLKKFESWENSWKGTFNVTAPATRGLTFKGIKSLEKSAVLLGEQLKNCKLREIP